MQHETARAIRVLVVEDECALQRWLTGHLEQHGMQCWTAETGAEAIRIYQEKQPQVVLMDVCLKEAMSGIETARVIAKIASERNAWLHLCYTTKGAVLPQDLEIVSYGVCELLLKPFQSATLINRIKAIQEILAARETAVDLVHRLRSIFEHSGDGYVLLDSHGTVVESNAAANQMVGADLAGQQLRNFQPGSSGTNLVSDTGQAGTRLRLERADGAQFDVEMHGTSIHIPARGLCFLAVWRDTSEILVREHANRHKSMEDALTGLPSRRLLEERLDQAISLARRNQRITGVLFANLDGFKGVNDAYGHEAGDFVLQQIAHRFRTLLRESDCVVRAGGDDFIFLLPELKDIADAETVAARVLALVSRPVRDRAQEYAVGVSIGIACYPSCGDNASTLLRHADLAMNAAKRHRQGAGKILSYYASLSDEQGRASEMERALTQALVRSEFRLHYQPQVDFRTGEIVGYEALLRWSHQGQLISPELFIPIAESTGQIIQIGAWVLQEAATQWKAWHTAYGWELPIAVNISPKELTDTLLQTISDTLTRAAVPTSAIEIEITESALAGSSEEAIAVINALREMGVRMSVDDFGVGASSLARLRSFPVSALKVDRAFVWNLASPADETLIITIVSIAACFGMGVVIEGVETEEQLRKLTSITEASQVCSWQGFHYSRPVPAAEIPDLMLQPSLFSGASPAPIKYELQEFP